MVVYTKQDKTKLFFFKPKSTIHKAKQNKTLKKKKKSVRLPCTKDNVPCEPGSQMKGEKELNSPRETITDISVMTRVTSPRPCSRI